MRSVTASLVFSGAMLFAAGEVVPAEVFRVGAAQVEITPPVGYRRAGGYHEDISQSMVDPLYAKALVFEQSTLRAALVVCDLCNIGRQVSDPVRQRASQRSGIPLENITVCMTHTHGGPEYYGTLRDLWHEAAVAKHGRDPHETVDYPALLAERVAEAVQQAAKSVRAVRLESGTARLPGIAFNRRFHMRDGSVQFNPGKKNPNIVGPAGPVDEDLPIVLFRDAQTDKPLASLTVFAMHVATFGDGRSFGADFPGVLQAKLRERFGPEFISVFGEGTAGDVNHVDVTSAAVQDGRAEHLRIGAKMAETWLAAMPSLQSVAAPRLAARSTRVPIPLIDVTAEQVAQARDVFYRKVKPHPEFMLLVEAWRTLNTHTLRTRDGATLQDEVQAMQLGENLALVTLPHEIFVELGMEIKRRSPFRQTLVLSLANDIDFYVPTRKAFAEGSYEVTTSSYQPGGGELLVDGAVNLLQEVKRDAGR
jgi:hypothetical protein